MLVAAMMLGVISVLLATLTVIWAMSRMQKVSSEIATNTVLSVSTAISQTLVGSIQPMAFPVIEQPQENSAESMMASQLAEDEEVPWEGWSSET